MERKLTPSFSGSTKNQYKTCSKSKLSCNKQEAIAVDINTMYENTLYNHLEGNYHLSNKKALFYNMRAFCEWKNEDVFEYLPYTFHIKDGLQDLEFIKFEKYYNQLGKNIESEESEKKLNNTWIVKPGENTNRGSGIQYCTEIDEIKDIVGKRVYLPTGKARSYIIQKYLDNPFLYNKRKFDIR
jgi:hypothetical protein